MFIADLAAFIALRVFSRGVVVIAATHGAVPGQDAEAIPEENCLVTERIVAEQPLLSRETQDIAPKVAAVPPGLLVIARQPRKPVQDLLG